MRLRLNEDSLAVKLETDRDFAINLFRIKNLPYSKYDPKNKEWLIHNLFVDEFLKNFSSTNISNFEDFLLTYTNFKKRRVEEVEKIKEEINKPLPELKLNLLLRDYQKQGVNFLLARKKGLLNMDIGVGKTITALVASWLVKKEGERILVVCPSSLKYQWEDEIEKWFVDKPKTVVINGDVKKRKEQYLEKADITITSYELLRRDLETIKNIPWRVVICDEATRFKHRKTLTHKSVIQLGSPYKFELTGSPIENEIDELWSLFKWLDESLFGNWTNFKIKYLVTRVVDWNGRRWEEIISHRNLDDLKMRIQPYIYRKTRREVLKELPDRIENVYYCQMTPEQYREYNRAVNFFEYKLSQGDYSTALEQLIYLRQVALDPRIKDLNAMGTKIEEIKNILDDMGFGKDGENIVVFCFFVRFLKLLEEELKDKYKVVLITGNDDSKTKQEKVDFFNANKNIVLLSSEVLSFGINLQKNCHIIINADIPLNPIVLENRIGRLDRMGQSKNVIVINLLTKGTVEEHVYNILKSKKELIEKLIGLDSRKKEVLADREFINYLLKGSTK